MQTILTINPLQAQRPALLRLWQRRLWLLPALLLGLAWLLATGRPAAAQSINNPAPFAIGRDHTCAITNSGGLKCWGYNSSGQFGDGSTAQSPIPVDIPGLTNLAAVAVGNNHTCVLTNSGGVKCFGINNGGQLGIGTLTAPNSTPVDVVGLTSGVVAIDTQGDTTCALTSGGGLKCWGNSGSEGWAGNSHTPVDVVGLTSGVSDFGVGRSHACALTSSGGVKCWGGNDRGQLGDGTYTPTSTPVDVVGLSSDVVAVDAGGYHSCALTSSGTVKCWGESHGSAPVDIGNLGNDIVAISVGGGSFRIGESIGGTTTYVCGLTSHGGLKCVGRNETGQLGNGTNTANDYASIPGYLITPAAVVGLGSGVIAVDAGTDATCALTRDQGLKCWGSNYVGKLGTSYYTNNWYIPAAVSGMGAGSTLIPAQLTIAKSDPDPAPPVAGQPVQYTIHVTNSGTVSLTNVTVTELPAATLTLTSLSVNAPATGSCSTVTRKCTLDGTLAPNAGATIAAGFDTPVTAGATISNTAYVTSTQTPWQTAPDGPIYLFKTYTPTAAATTDLAVTKSASVTQAATGAAFAYTITVTNNDTAAATNVRAVDTLPAGVTFDSATATNGGSCNNVSGTVTCTWGTLAAGASVSATINVTP